MTISFVSHHRMVGMVNNSHVSRNANVSSRKCKMFVKTSNIQNWTKIKQNITQFY